MRLALICSFLLTILPASIIGSAECAFNEPLANGRFRQPTAIYTVNSKSVVESYHDLMAQPGSLLSRQRHEAMTPRTARIEAPLATLSSLLVSPPIPAHAAVQPFEETMKMCFPTALSTSAVSTRVRSVLSSRSFDRSNTLFGTSISPDEINTKPKESLRPVLEDYLGKHSGSYALGGIGGLPLQGVGGMKEFLSHCPRKGRIFLLFGPNVGISDNGTIGRVERLGQRGLSECCEPGLETYNIVRARIESEQKATTPASQYDYALDGQMEFILTRLQKFIDTPKASQVSPPAIPVFMTLQMYKLGQAMIMEQLEACLESQARREGTQELVLLGGIIINRGQVLGSIEPREDYFQPLLFESYNGEVDVYGKLEEPTELYESTFGDSPFANLFSE